MTKLTLEIFQLSFSNSVPEKRQSFLLLKLMTSNIEITKHSVTFMAWISSINLSTRFWFFNFKSSEPLQIKSVIIKKKLNSVNFISPRTK